MRDLKIHVLNDRLRAHLLFDFYGNDLSLLLEGRLRVEDGYLCPEPIRAQLGSLPVLRAALDPAVRRLFNAPENREKFRLPPDIRDVHIEDGKRVVSYC